MWQTQPQPRLGLAHMMAVVLFHHVLSLGLGSHDFPIEKHTVVEYNNVLVWKLVRQHHQVPVFFWSGRKNAHVLSWGSDDDLHSRFLFPPWYILVHWFSVGDCADDARNTWWSSLMTIPMNESRCYMPSRCSLACEAWDSSIEGQLPEICCPKVPTNLPYISRLVSGSSKATWLFGVAWEWHQ